MLSIYIYRHIDTEVDIDIGISRDFQALEAFKANILNILARVLIVRINKDWI